MNGMPPGAWRRDWTLSLDGYEMAPEECTIASGDWPDLPFPDWAETCVTLHLWMQVVGKVRLAHAPMLNHWWQVPLYVTCRGLTTSPIPYGCRTFQIDFDFIDHILELRTSNGDSDTMLLCPRSVADFHEELMRRLRGLGLETRIWTMPVEIPDAIPFEQDRANASYDPEYVARFSAHSRPGGPSVEAVSRAIPREGESGAFLLGQLRYGGQLVSPDARRPD